MMADIRVDLRCVRPVRLHRHEVEPLLLNERLCDPGAHPVELRRAMAGFPQQDQARTAEALEERAEVG
jgi:hypothetical protein